MKHVLMICAFIVLGCGGDDDDTAPDASADAPVGQDASSDAATDAATSDASTEDAATADAAVEGTIEWLTEDQTEPVQVDSDIALDYGFQYSVAIPEGATGYTRLISRCAHIAGFSEECDESDLAPAESGTFFVRWGIDPSMYAIGDNQFRFIATLKYNSVSIASDELVLNYHVTDCMECIGAP